MRYCAFVIRAPELLLCQVSRGEVEATVEFTGARTFFGKTAAMIQSVEQLSNIQRVLIRIMVFLLAISFVLCGLCLAYLLARGEPFLHSVAYVVVLLVASIPIAMEARLRAVLSREAAAREHRLFESTHSACRL